MNKYGKPELSGHFQKRKSSVIRTAQIEFLKRKDAAEAINLAIGNVSLPMHPAMIRRLSDLRAKGSPFQNGAVRYTPTVGMEETRGAFRHVIASSGFDVDRLQVQITELDVRIRGEPTAEKLDRQADTYREIMETCLAAKDCTAFITWGFTDRHSWIPAFWTGWGSGLIFDESYRPKPAYGALQQALSAPRGE